MKEYQIRLIFNICMKLINSDPFIAFLEIWNHEYCRTHKTPGDKVHQGTCSAKSNLWQQFNNVWEMDWTVVDNLWPDIFVLIPQFFYLKYPKCSDWLKMIVQPHYPKYSKYPQYFYLCKAPIKYCTWYMALYKCFYCCYYLLVFTYGIFAASESEMSILSKLF
jgi:hypothetical protein